MTMTKLEKANQALIEKRAAGEMKYLNPMQKSAQQPGSLRKAVKAKCWECIGGVNALREIAHCTAWSCPLWPVRPYRNKAPDSYGETERAAAVARIEATTTQQDTDAHGGACLNSVFNDD